MKLRDVGLEADAKNPVIRSRTLGGGGTERDYTPAPRSRQRQWPAGCPAAGSTNLSRPAPP